MRELRGLLARSMTALAFLLASGLTACHDGSPGNQSIDLLSDHGLRAVVRPRAGSAPEPGKSRLVASWDFDDGSPGSWWIRTYGGQTRGGVSADADAQLHVAVMPNTEYLLDAYVRTVDLQPSSARVYGTFYLGEFSYRRDVTRALPAR